LFTIQATTADNNYEFVHSNFLIDIDAPLTWHDCIVQWNTLPDHCPEGAVCTFPVTCEEYQCADVRTSYSYKSPHRGQITCAPSSTFQTFPANITGVMALSSSAYALPASLNRPPLKGTFSLCFPSTSAPGILFIGNGPCYLLPQLEMLTYGRSVDLPVNTTAKLSTIEPYTILRTDIYNSVTRKFSKLTKRIPKANPIKPFSLCFSTSTNGTQAGLKFPDIDFNLQGGKNWTISSGNSFKQITQDVACMAFVDGGEKNWIISNGNSFKQITQDVACMAFVDGGSTSEHAIVIGTYQIEDNNLLFDLENSSFWFSSSLLHKRTSCANFNFTMVD
nr:hypothetical protein [Tanacetum cinerariifolium]